MTQQYTSPNQRPPKNDMTRAEGFYWVRVSPECNPTDWTIGEYLPSRGTWYVIGCEEALQEGNDIFVGEFISSPREGTGIELAGGHQ